MPGFGSSGLTSIDVEAGQGGRNRLSTTVDGRSNKPTPLHMLPIGERTSEESELTDGPTTRTGGAFRQSQVPSEEYIIEGALTSSVAGKATYRDGWQSSHSANSSEVELNRMEPLHTQSDGQVGLGSPTGR